MRFLVSETAVYVVHSEDSSEAIAGRKRGEGIRQSEHTSWRVQFAENVTPIPRQQWPLWAKALAAFSKPEDKGIGDTVRRMIGEENSEAFKKWFKATTGKDCGCTGRQRRWNIEYPL